MKYIDLRSDTVTMPTKEMREAMAGAIVGDDVYEDDSTVKELESYAAELVGKEAALFVPSGTFGNQLSLLTWCNRGDEVIIGHNNHIAMYEVGGAAVIAAVNLRTVTTKDGIMDPEEVSKLIREDDIHYPETGLICVENAHSSGNVIPLENMKEIYNIAKENKIPVHLDGARVFNAAEYLKVDVKELCQYTDSIMFCLSKGLCSPVGSILAGSKEFINKARKYRKMMGGGMRQAGILAAAGLISLKEIRNRLSEDHDNAIYLAKKLDELDFVSVFWESLKINMVFFKLSIPVEKESQFMDYMNSKDIKLNPPNKGVVRFVTHNDISQENIDYVIDCIKLFI